MWQQQKERSREMVGNILWTDSPQNRCRQQGIVANQQFSLLRCTETLYRRRQDFCISISVDFGSILAIGPLPDGCETLHGSIKCCLFTIAINVDQKVCLAAVMQDLLDIHPLDKRKIELDLMP